MTEIPTLWSACYASGKCNEICSKYGINYDKDMSGDESIVNAAVSVVINGEIGNCTTTEEVKAFFKDNLGFEDVMVSMAAEQA